MLQLKVLVSKISSIYRLSACAIPTGKIPALQITCKLQFEISFFAHLNHEVGYNAVKLGALVAKSLFTSTQCPEVLYIKFKHNSRGAED